MKSQMVFANGGKINDFRLQEKADTFTLDVKDIGKINSRFGLAKVCINVSHDRVSDLKIELLSPDGTQIWLTNRNGGIDGRNYLGTCFRQGGFSGFIRDAQAPFMDEYTPDGRLEFFNNGQIANGTWRVLVSDLKQGITGTLNEIMLHFENDPQPLTSLSPCDFSHAKDCYASDPNGLLLPDLVLVKSITQNSIKFFPKDDPNFPSQLRFAAAIANFGEGPMEIFGKDEWYCDDIMVKDGHHKCKDGSRPRQKIYQRLFKKVHSLDTLQYEDHQSGTNYYDDKPGHNHFHVDHWVSFSVVKNTKILGLFHRKSIIAKGSKVSYCLFDSGICQRNDNLCMYANGSSPDLKNYGLGGYITCDSNKQGISVGGYDTYGYMYEGQNLDLPKNIKSGDYQLLVTLDPENLYQEKSKKNNTYIFNFSIP